MRKPLIFWTVVSRSEIRSDCFRVLEIEIPIPISTSSSASPSALLLFSLSCCDLPKDGDHQVRLLVGINPTAEISQNYSKQSTILMDWAYCWLLKSHNRTCWHLFASLVFEMGYRAGHGESTSNFFYICNSTCSVRVSKKVSCTCIWWSKYSFIYDIFASNLIYLYLFI